MSIFKLQRAPLATLALCLATVMAPGCGGSDSGGYGEQGEGAGLGQGGAQDFGLFRQILEAGELPNPNTLDDVGFFNEHKLELPAADCGEDVCLHGLFGRMDNMINGSACTTVLLGMNTPINPEDLERPPLNLAIAIDTSGSMQGPNMDYTREGLIRMVSALQPGDQVSLVSFSDDAVIMTDAAAYNDPALSVAINDLAPAGSTNIYAGLRTAFEQVALHQDPTRQNRVILLSDGMATTGITADHQLLDLTTAYSSEGIGLTTIGMGTEFNVTLMRDLSELGSGSFYFLEDPMAVQEVFVDEVEAFLVPLAEDVEIDIQASTDYHLRGVYGTKQAEFTSGSGSIYIPSLHIAHRTSASDQEGGRRGGGGGIVLELLESATAPGQGLEVGQLTLRYRRPGTEEIVEQHVDISSPYGFNDPQAFFDNLTAEKSFVTLNIFVGFQLASQRATSGDLTGALNVLDGLASNVRGWLEQHADADIQDDLRYIDMFRDNLVAHGALAPAPGQAKPQPWPQD